MKNNFENIVKQTLDNHEMPYDEGAWERFEKANTTTPFYKSKWFIGGVALLIIATTISLYNIDNSSKETNLTANIDNNQVSEINSFVKSNNSSKEEVKNDLTLDINPKSEKNNEFINIEKETKLPFNIENNLTDSSNTELAVSTPIKDEINNSEDKKIESPSTFTNDSSEINKPTKAETKTPVASFYIEKSLCEESDIILIADNYDESYKYSWTLNEGPINTGNIITLKATKIGKNTVTLFINKGTTLIDEKSQVFDVLESPSDIVKIDQDNTSLINKLTFEMDDISNSINWNFGDGTSSPLSSSTHTYNKAGLYKCEYTITSNNGCSNTFERNINVKGYYNLRTDYGFSPGVIDNLNDVFIPVELKELNVPFEMSIFARNGQLIYTTTSLDKPWNGKLKDGSTCTFGSYVWVVTLTNELGHKEEYKGTVTNVSN